MLWPLNESLQTFAGLPANVRRPPANVRSRPANVRRMPANVRRDPAKSCERSQGRCVHPFPFLQGSDVEVTLKRPQWMLQTAWSFSTGGGGVLNEPTK